MRHIGSEEEDRLRIGVRGTSVLRTLLRETSPPYWILYLHLVPRTSDAPGRYQSEAPWGGERLERFLDDYADLLETDGRYDLWIKPVDGPDHLIYDRHEIVYAYGDVDRFQRVLEARGYVPGDVLIPNPHERPYRAANDEAQRRLFDAFEWTHFPLTEDDLR